MVPRLLQHCYNGFSNFFDLCRATLDQDATRKQKYAQGNHMSFINKAHSKEIMKRIKPRNKFLKDRTDENKKKIFVTAKLLCFTFLESKKGILWKS